MDVATQVKILQAKLALIERRDHFNHMTSIFNAVDFSLLELNDCPSGLRCAVAIDITYALLRNAAWLSSPTFRILLTDEIMRRFKLSITTADRTIAAAFDSCQVSKSTGEIDDKFPHYVLVMGLYAKNGEELVLELGLDSKTVNRVLEQINASFCNSNPTRNELYISEDHAALGEIFTSLHAEIKTDADALAKWRLHYLLQDQLSRMDDLSWSSISADELFTVLRNISIDRHKSILVDTAKKMIDQLVPSKSLIDRLESLDLLYRVPDTRARRTTTATLTPAGEKLVGDAVARFIIKGSVSPAACIQALCNMTDNIQASVIQILPLTPEYQQSLEHLVASAPRTLGPKAMAAIIVRFKGKLPETALTTQNTHNHAPFNDDSQSQPQDSHWSKTISRLLASAPRSMDI